MEKLNNIDIQLFAEEGEEELEETPVAGEREETEVVDDSAGEEEEFGAEETTVEEEMISKSQAQKAIQERLAREKQKMEQIKKESDKFKSTMEQIARSSNMSVEQVIDYVNQQVEGQNPAAGSYNSNLEEEIKNASSVAMETRREMEEDKLSRDPLYKDYDDIKDEVRDFADTYGMPLEQAYWAVNGPSRAKTLKSETEQKVLQDVKKRRGLGAESDATPEIKKLGLSKEELNMAKSVGMEPEEFAAMKGMRGIGDYEEYKSKKKG